MIIHHLRRVNSFSPCPFLERNTLSASVHWLPKLIIKFMDEKDWMGPLLLSRSVASDSVWSHALQHARLLCPLLSPRVCSNSCPLSHWRHPTQHQGLFQWVSSLHQVAKESELQLQQIHTDIIMILFSPVIKICSASLTHRVITVHRSVVSDSLRPHGLQYARLPCPLLSPGVYSN